MVALGSRLVPECRRSVLWIRSGTAYTRNDMGLNRQTGLSGDSGTCPFASGFGQVTPYFAGRGIQQRAASNCLAAMRSGGRFENCLIFWGPPGNGKTAMLAWAAAEGRSRGIQVQACVASELATREQLIEKVAGRPRWTERVGEISLGSFRWKPSPRSEDALDHILMRRIRKAPLALLIDEAQTLEPSVGGMILNAVQKLASRDAAILLVLAGTPDLADCLAQTEATFWERSGILPVDLLSEQDASDAVRVPFESAGRAISAEALAGVVSASDGYPYFLQIWGRLLWSDSSASATRVTKEDVNGVQSAFRQKRDTFYDLRLRELERLDLGESAVAVAGAYGGRHDLHWSELEASLKPIVASQGTGRDAASVVAIVRQLESVGFIWQPRCATPGCYSRGIPGLMDYVLREARSDGRSSTS